MPAALIALALGAFGIGTTEFVIVGLLEAVASDTGVSVPAAGMLVTGYALGVVIGAPIMAMLGNRMPSKTLLLALMGVFIAGNIVCAIAPNYEVLLIGRLVAALCHGAFFGTGSLVAAKIVAPERKAAAIALMFTGLTLANVLGVPLGTALGQYAGWRSTFALVAVLGVLAAVGIMAWVPRDVASERADLRAQLAVFTRGRVWLALACTAFGFGGVFASFTYVSPMLTGLAGYSPSAVAWLLVVFGLGLCLGNLVGGRAADRALMPAIYVILAALVVVLVVLTVAVHWKIAAAITLFVFGFVGFATVPPLQTRVLQQAADAPALASAANIAAFNLGNAVGAAVSGWALQAAWGYESPNLIGAAFVAVALTLAVASGRLDVLRRRPRSSPAPPQHAEPAGSGAVST